MTNRFVDIAIRPAKIEDARAIGEAERAIAQTPGFLRSAPDEILDANIEKSIRHESIYLVAEHGGKIVGHAALHSFSLRSMQHIASLNLVIHLAWQNKGIGTKLLKQVIALAKEAKKWRKIELNVRVTNNVAIALYHKFGFQTEGRLKEKVRVGDSYVDELIMGLHLR